MDNLSGVKILIVDDEEFNVFILENVLELEQAKVASVKDGMLALKHLEADSSYDVILTDIMMPNLDGYELIKAIQASEQFSKIPIIAVSANAVGDEADKCKALGAVDYIHKPIDIEKLIEMIKQHLTITSSS